MTRLHAQLLTTVVHQSEYILVTAHPPPSRMPNHTASRRSVE